jgi:hypothetical protein
MIQAVVEHVQSVVAGLGHAEWAAIADHSERVRRLVTAVPGAVWDKVSAEVAARYHALEERYGRPTAITIVSAGILASAVPIPGTTVLATAPLIAVVELHHRLTAGHGAAAGAVKTHLAESQVLHLGRQWMQDLSGVFRRSHTETESEETTR